MPVMKLDSVFSSSRAFATMLYGETRTATVALASLVAVGCVSAELEFDELEVTRQNLTFPGAVQLATARLGTAAQSAGTLPESQSAGTLPESQSAGTLPEGQPAVAAAGVPSSVAVPPSEAQLPAPTQLPAAAQLQPTEAELVASLSGLAELELPIQTFAFSNAASGGVLPDEIAASLAVTEVTIRAQNGSPPLGFIRGLSLRMTLPGEKPLTLVNYKASSTKSQSTNRKLVLPVRGSPAHLDPWRIQSCLFELSVTVDPYETPWQPWAVEITLTLSGSIEANY